MSKLYFYYSAMNAGKTTTLLQSAYNYHERGMRTRILTPKLDNRSGEGVVASRIGLKAEGLRFERDDDLLALIDADIATHGKLDCVLVDEAQFLSKAQVWQLTDVVDLRGIPVLYYGSETGFMRGAAEHAGNRNYYGVEGIAAAAGHPIHEHLKRIAKVRRDSIALQRGLQLDLEFAGDRAAFYRVYQHEGVNQTALVLLNKADAPTTFKITEALQAGPWRSALDGTLIELPPGKPFEAEVPAHGVQVFMFDAVLTDPTLLASLDDAMAHRLGVQQVPPADQH